MQILKEFKEFAVRGNVIDMAVGIIIGTAFTKIVNSVVTDILMPPLGLLAGEIDFSDRKFVLREAVAASEGVAAVPEVSVNYGQFANVVINFIIVAFAVFLLVKAINHLKRKEEAEATPPPSPGPTVEQQLLTDIRDLLRESAAR